MFPSTSIYWLFDKKSAFPLDKDPKQYVVDNGCSVQLSTNRHFYVWCWSQMNYLFLWRKERRPQCLNFWCHESDIIRPVCHSYWCLLWVVTYFSVHKWFITDRGSFLEKKLRYPFLIIGNEFIIGLSGVRVFVDAVRWTSVIFCLCDSLHKKMGMQ